MFTDFSSYSPPVLVPSIVSFSSLENRQARVQQNLEYLPAIVLKNIVDPMDGSQFLKLSDRTEQFKELFVVGMRLHFCSRANRSTTSTPRTIARRSMLSMEMFFSFLSTFPI